MDSPSPIRTYVRQLDLSRYLALMASPMPALSPGPSEPVATSTKFNLGVGWPSRSDSMVRKRNSSSGLNAPASAQAAYKSGAAWPLDRTNRSLFGCLGFFGSNRMTEKNRVAAMSAAEQQLVGCPLPASVVERTLRIRSRVAR